MDKWNEINLSSCMHCAHFHMLIERAAPGAQTLPIEEPMDYSSTSAHVSVHGNQYNISGIGNQPIFGGHQTIIHGNATFQVPSSETGNFKISQSSRNFGFMTIYSLIF